MKNAELYQLAQGFQAVANLSGVKFAYAVAKNARKVGAAVEDLEKSRAPSEAFKAFDKARVALCVEHAEKDDDGKPIMVTADNGQRKYRIANPEAFEADLQKLRGNGHAEAVAEQERKDREFADLLEEESDVKLHTISLDLVPDAVTAGQLQLIYPMIAEPEK